MGKEKTTDHAEQHTFADQEHQANAAPEIDWEAYHQGGKTLRLNRTPRHATKKSTDNKNNPNIR